MITNAATGDSDVEALVHIDAFVPEGETVVPLATAEPGSAIGGDPATVFDAVPIPGSPGEVDLGTLVRVLPPAAQRFMAERADAVTVEVKASHLPMVSRPGAVTRLILDAAETVD